MGTPPRPRQTRQGCRERGVGAGIECIRSRSLSWTAPASRGASRRSRPAVGAGPGRSVTGVGMWASGQVGAFALLLERVGERGRVFPVTEGARADADGGRGAQFWRGGIEEPIALLTPFVNGGQRLPTAYDRARIQSLTFSGIHHFRRQPFAH